jgi:L-ribulose-5-phosphate 3-epimerase
MLLLGYNTNGFAHHRLTDAIDIIADLGYRAIAISIDIHSLNPFDPGHFDELAAVGRHFQRRNMRCVIETGARFLLDARRKHWPTLVSANAADRQRRLEFLKRAIDMAAELAASAVSFWSGAADPGVTDDEAFKYLCAGCHTLIDYAAPRSVPLAFEPEPGMLVETCDQYARLSDELRHPLFGLVIDVGHVHCLADGDPAARIVEYARQLRVIHIEDMRVGVHDHLMFGEGNMEFRPIMAALSQVKYTGPVVVELSRHSHDAVNAARRAYEFLTQITR